MRACAFVLVGRARAGPLEFLNKPSACNESGHLAGPLPNGTQLLPRRLSNATAALTWVEAAILFKSHPHAEEGVSIQRQALNFRSLS